VFLKREKKKTGRKEKKERMGGKEKTGRL